MATCPVKIMAQGKTVNSAKTQQMTPSMFPAAASSGTNNPGISINIGGATGDNRVSLGLQLLALLTVLTLVPSILVMMTSFTRISVTLGFVRRALSVQEVPPTQVLLGLALFLTFFVMAPTFKEINENALQPYLRHEIGDKAAFAMAEKPIREFMFKQTRKDDLSLFINIAKLPRPKVKGDIPTYVLIPSFMISELRTSFIIGFVIYIPFLVVDMVIASILLSMGMFMLPPVLISLPFKLILFVLVDGWNLVIGSLIKSFYN